MRHLHEWEKANTKGENATGPDHKNSKAVLDLIEVLIGEEPEDPKQKNLLTTEIPDGMEEQIKAGGPQITEVKTGMNAIHSSFLK